MLRWIQAWNLPAIDAYSWLYESDRALAVRRTSEHIVSDFLDLRYRRLPYVYSHTALVSHQGGTFMRPLIFDFSQDKEALKQQNEYMFGNSLTD